MIITLIVFFVVLSILVLAHELGHFSTARKFGAKVEEFGLGLPPRIFGIRKNEGKFELVGGKFRDDSGPTIYSINWIPVGGFVKIRGENGEDKENPQSFANKPIWQRIIMIAAGVFMNLVLCFIFLAIGYGIGVPTVVGDAPAGGQVISGSRIQVMEAMKDLPADQAGLRTGDVIVSVDGQTFENAQALNEYLSVLAGQTAKVSIERGDDLIDKDISVVDYGEAVGVGISVIETAIVRYPWYLAVWQGLRMTWIWLVTIITAFVILIKNLLIGVPTGVEVAGPVGIAVMTGQFARLGLVYILQFTAMLSINLAIINFLPFPALDGGRIIFLLIEKIRGKAIKQQWENLAHNIGFMLLMALILFITVRDIGKYSGGMISWLGNIFGF